MDNEKTCQNCGESVIKTAQFCPGCGQAYLQIDQVEKIQLITGKEQSIQEKQKRLDQLNRVSWKSRLLTISGIFIIGTALIIPITIEQVNGMFLVITGSMILLGFILVIRASSMERKAFGNQFIYRGGQRNQRQNLEDELEAAKRELAALRQQLDQFSGGQGG